MTLTLEQIRHVAALARLSLSPEEEQRYPLQLSAILESFAQLAALPTDGVEPTSHAQLAAALLRADVVQPSLGAERALAGAPAKAGTHFVVPKILE